MSQFISTSVRLVTSYTKQPNKKRSVVDAADLFLWTFKHPLKLNTYA